MLRSSHRVLLIACLGALANGCGSDEGPTGPVPVAAVVVSPDAVNLAVGGSQQLTAVVQDQAGNSLSRTITWTTVNATIATVTAGTVIAVGEGTTDVSAVADGVAGTVVVTVSAPEVASVDVRPLDAEVPLGETLQLTATPRDQGGTPLIGRTVAWSSSDEALATVDATGLVSGVAGGDVVITATVDQRGGSTDVEVVDPTAPRISVITPFPMVEGASATMAGVNFGATVGENAVTVAGVAATVTAADPSSVTFTVPPTDCSPHREVPVRVTAGGKSDTHDHPLRPTVTQVGVGDQVILSGPGAPCLQFDASQSFESYLVGVQSISEDPNDLLPIQLTAETGVGAGAATVAARLAASAATAPLDVSSPEATPGAYLLGDKARRHLAARPAQGQFPELSPSAFAAAAAGALQNVIPADPTVGDQFTVRVPPHFPGECGQFETVTAELRLVTDGGYWLIDTADLAIGSFSDGQLQQIATEFEDDVTPALESTFGPIPDTDSNGKVAFVVTGAVNRQGWLSYASLFDYLPVAGCAASNEGDWAYLRTPEAGPGGISALELLGFMGPSLAHDFTHVIQNRTVIAGGLPARVDPWIEEGQAELGSEVFTHAVTGRSPGQNYGSGPAFAEGGYSAVGNLGFYYGFIGIDDPRAVGAPQECSWLLPLTSGTPAGPCIANAAFSGAWAFLRWLTDHYAAAVGGEGAFHQALIDASGPGFERVATLAGVPIETLLARSAASLYVDDRVALAEPTLGFPSWNLFDVSEGVVEQARLAPRSLGFTELSETASVRAASTAYYLISGPGHPATAIEVTAPGGGQPSPDIQVWAVRLQ